jgi:hypothetical protein
MPALLIRHKVTNYAKWQSDFDKEEPTRSAHGCLVGRIFRNVSDPDEILILLGWDNIERARLFAQSDELWEQLKRDEVTDDADLWFLHESN